jgi:putative sporulation protein YtaF
MLVGKGITTFFKPQTASRLGAVMIIVIGLVFLLQFCRQKLRDGQADEEEPLLSLKIKPLGIIIQILREPASADFDQSGEIGLREAFFLGLALAMDAFGAGIGIAMAGYNILLTALCVGVLKFILVSSGLKLGTIVEDARWQYISSLATGMILVIIGLSELI